MRYHRENRLVNPLVYKLKNPGGNLTRAHKATDRVDVTCALILLYIIYHIIIMKVVRTCVKSIRMSPLVYSYTHIRSLRMCTNTLLYYVIQCQINVYARQARAQGQTSFNCCCLFAVRPCEYFWTFGKFFFLIFYYRGVTNHVSGLCLVRLPIYHLGQSRAMHCVYCIISGVDSRLLVLQGLLQVLGHIVEFLIRTRRAWIRCWFRG